MHGFVAAISIPGMSGASRWHRYEASAVMARPTVLLVDDDIVVLATLSKLLNHFGYTTAGASNSEAAMDYVVNARNRFDVIVTDLAMPDVDGVALLSAAKP